MASEFVHENKKDNLNFKRRMSQLHDISWPIRQHNAMHKPRAFLSSDAVVASPQLDVGVRSGNQWPLLGFSYFYFLFFY